MWLGELYLIAVIELAFVITTFLTRSVLDYALARQILDHPNERSSHKVATPRGGGAAIVIVVLIGMAICVWAGGIPARASAFLMAGGLLVAAVGWWDDRWSLAAGWRFLAHVCAAVLVAVALWPALWMVPLIIVGVTCFLNITNFMDGIDGIAASEAAFVFAGAATLGATQWSVPLAIAAAACCGFVLWNWPPAKIFLGDVGSGFLGLMMAALILYSAAARPSIFWSMVILPGAFLVDGGLTILRRMLTGQHWTQAHRSHAYQHAAQRWGHRTVTIFFAALNFFWILPIALAARMKPAFGPALLVASWLPLMGLAIWQRAGNSQPDHGNLNHDGSDQKVDSAAAGSASPISRH